MGRESDRERLLSVATEKGWLRWLQKREISIIACLFCEAYRDKETRMKNCVACTGRDVGCREPDMFTYRSDSDMLAAAAKRLYHTDIITYRQYESFVKNLLNKP